MNSRAGKSPYLAVGSPRWNDRRIGYLSRVIERHPGEFWLWAHRRELAALVAGRAVAEVRRLSGMIDKTWAGVAKTSPKETK